MKIGPKIGSIAGGVFLILLFSGYTSFICVQDLIDSNKTAMKTVKTLRELENLLGRVADLESTGRGYILSGEITQRLMRSDELRRTGHRTLDEIDEQINKVLTEADSSVLRVKGLAERIHDLDGLSVIMDDMANRVGILSVSSQIEAKKNSGSGFEAFADEMKDLWSFSTP
jgi:methyl-accepting chemotaxis protein